MSYSSAEDRPARAPDAATSTRLSDMGHRGLGPSPGSSSVPSLHIPELRRPASDVLYDDDVPHLQLPKDHPKMSIPQASLPPRRESAALPRPPFSLSAESPQAKEVAVQTDNTDDGGGSAFSPYSPRFPASPVVPAVAALPQPQPPPPTALPPAPHDDPSVFLSFKEGEPPLLGDHSKLEEVRLSGVVGEAVVATIPTRGLDPLKGVPLVVKATVETTSPCSSAAAFSVSPTYLSVSSGELKAGVAPRSFRIRLLADRPGEYASVLHLEYVGVDIRVPLRGVIKERRLEPQQEWERAAATVPRGQGPFASAGARGGAPALPAQAAAVRWGRLLVGCVSVREVRLRNCMEGRGLVRASLEGEMS